jgi:hypothetical protein
MGLMIEKVHHEQSPRRRQLAPAEAEYQVKSSSSHTRRDHSPSSE